MVVLEASSFGRIEISAYRSYLKLCIRKDQGDLLTSAD